MEMLASLTRICLGIGDVKTAIKRHFTLKLFVPLLEVNNT